MCTPFCSMHLEKKPACVLRSVVSMSWSHCVFIPHGGLRIGADIFKVSIRLYTLTQQFTPAASSISTVLGPYWRTQNWKKLEEEAHIVEHLIQFPLSLPVSASINKYGYLPACCFLLQNCVICKCFPQGFPLS